MSNCPPCLARAAAVIALAGPALAFSADHATAGKLIERGRYLVRVTGCNDCHTANYGESAGSVSEKEWLTGSPVGFRGPWGTTYASNLRLVLSRMDETQWIRNAHMVKMRPPMPWFALRDMHTEDLRAIYRFVRHLGPAGSDVPDYVPPGKQPNGPVIQFPG